MSGIVGSNVFAKSGKIGKVAYFSVKQNASTGIGTSTVYEFNTTIRDDYGAWDHSNETYTIPCTGLWTFQCGIMLNAPGEVRVIESAIFRTDANGNTAEIGVSSMAFGDHSSGSNNHPGMTITATSPCVKNDVIKAGCTGHLDPTSGLNMRGGDCYFFGHQLSNIFN